MASSLPPPLKQPSALFILFFTLQFLSSAKSESFIGVNYGMVADNLPKANETAELLKSTIIQKVRLYGADPNIIRELANSGIGIVVGAANGEIQNLASNPEFARQWVEQNVLAYGDSDIIVVSVGNEVMSSMDQNLISRLLLAMQNVQNALNLAGISGKTKVSTVHSMEVLGQSDPPSSGAFRDANTMTPLLQFLNESGSPFMINPYPYFAYLSDQRPETLDFCLFNPNPGRVDAKNSINYMNMFDAQVDAIYSALNAAGFKDVEIVVAETGWPSNGEVGATMENAKAYNGNLIKHLRSRVGTPLMSGKSVDTYIFSLYDEDMKPGDASEKYFGLFQPNLTATYDVGIMKTSPDLAPSPLTPATFAPTTPLPDSVLTPTPMVVSPVANHLSPVYQAGQSIGRAMSCKPPGSLQIVLVVMGAFMMIMGHEEEEERYFMLR